VLDDWLVKLEFELESSMSASSVTFWGENSELDRRRLRLRGSEASMAPRLESSGLSLARQSEESRFLERVRIDSRLGVDMGVALSEDWVSAREAASSAVGEGCELDASSIDASEDV